MSFQISNTCFKEVTQAPAKSNTEKLHLDLQNQLNATNQGSELLSQEFNLLTQCIEKTQQVLADTNNKFVCLNRSSGQTQQSLVVTQQCQTTTSEKLIIVNRNLELLDRKIEDLKENNSEMIAMLQANDQNASQLRVSIAEDSRSLATLEAQTRNMIHVMNQLIILQQQI